MSSRPSLSALRLVGLAVLLGIGGLAGAAFALPVDGDLDLRYGVGGVARSPERNRAFYDPPVALACGPTGLCALAAGRRVPDEDFSGSRYGSDGSFEGDFGTHFDLGDMIDGGVGDDVLYGDVRIPIVDAIREGDIATGTGLKGDGILGGAGDDWVVGAAGNDWLAGGGGDDLIVGGGGDDDIQGDSGAFPWANPAWRVERVRVFEGENERFEMVLHDMMVRDLSPAGRDTIHAGDGDDWVYGNGADDLPLRLLIQNAGYRTASTTVRTPRRSPWPSS